MNANTPSSTPAYVATGMPPMDTLGRYTSFFEFWSIWLMYPPVAIQWCGLALWYGSPSLPLIANPAIPLSGMVGVPNSAVFEAGVLYVRFPGERQGTITSLTLKHSPYVVGDGGVTLGELVDRDPRTGQLQHL